MTLRRKAGVLVLGAASLAGGLAMPVSPASPASADRLTHVVTMGGSVRVKDDEVIDRRDKYCNRTLAARGDAQLESRSSVLLSETDNKCGGEVRVEFHLTARLGELQDGDDNPFNNPPQWCVSGIAELYEGARDTSSDLDGTKVLPEQCGTPGQMLVWDDIVRNTAESRSSDFGDYLVQVQLA
jgi:hypothetical protein